MAREHVLGRQEVHALTSAKKNDAARPCGSVVRLPVRRRDVRFYDGLTPVGYLVDDVSPREFAGVGVDSDSTPVE